MLQGLTNVRGGGKNICGDLKGKLVFTGGMGGMGGRSRCRHDEWGAFLGIDVDPERSKRRVYRPTAT